LKHAISKNKPRGRNPWAFACAVKICRQISDKLIYLARAAANRRAVKAHVAAATAVAALGAAFAASLQRRAGLFVAAGASNAATVGGVLALAMAIGKRALAALNAVLRAAAAAAAVAQHAAQVLQRSARKLIFATAVDFEPACAFFELDFAPRNHTPIARRRSGGREARRLPRLSRARSGRRTGGKTFH
jgi:hypothetical protein